MSNTSYHTNADAAANHQNIVGGTNEPIDLTVKHHVHRDDEPLPGARGGAHTVDYTPDVIDHTKLPPSEEGDTQDLSRRDPSRNRSSNPLQNNPTGSGAPHTGPTQLQQEAHGVPIQHIPSQPTDRPEGPQSHPSSFVASTPDKSKSFDMNGNEKNTPRHTLDTTNDDDPLGYGKFGGAGRAPKVGDITANMNEHEGSSSNREGTGVPVGVPAASQNRKQGEHGKGTEVKETLEHPVTHFKEDVKSDKNNEHHIPEHKEKASLGDKVIGKTQQVRISTRGLTGKASSICFLTDCWQDYPQRRVEGEGRDSQARWRSKLIFMCNFIVFDRRTFGIRSALFFIPSNDPLCIIIIDVHTVYTIFLGQY